MRMQAAVLNLPEPVSDTGAARWPALDALRGAVMVVMALDHVRDFFHAGAMSFAPEDLARTTPALFFTRWITHVCAPVFMFAAGMGASLRLRHGGSKATLSRFLWTRGLWLVLIELTVMRLAMNFTLDVRNPVLLLVLSALGISMIALAGLIHLPLRVLAAASLAVIALHNTLDGLRAPPGALSALWTLLHQPGAFVVSGVVVVVGYPVLPWIAVMAAGYCFGQVLPEGTARRRVLLTTGGLLCAGFLLLRAVNLYGDPAPWSLQTSATLTLLSFLRTTKYPPSLAFLMMTLGPALLGLALLDRRRLAPGHPLVVIGRVPFFYYVTHFWLIHLAASFMAWVRYGEASFRFLFHPLPSMGGARELFPAGFGYSLWVVYAVWIATVLSLYPLCRWMAQLKARRRDWWLSYL